MKSEEFATALEESSSLFLSTAVAQESGRRISNQPKKERANTISKRNMKMLNTAFVDMALRVSEPKSAVTSSPKPR